MNTAAETETETTSIQPAGKTPAGMTVTWQLKIVTGKEAQALLEMQNQAIINLLTWAKDHVKPAGKELTSRTGIHSGDARETMEKAA